MNPTLNIRSVFVLPLATGVTVGLFLIMQALIAVTHITIDDEPSPHFPSITYEPPALKDELPAPPKPKPVEAQPQVDLAKWEPSEGEKIVVNIVGPAPTRENPTISRADSNSVVLLMPVSPQYPERLRQRGIEGYVDLAFTVTSAGTTENFTVIRSQPERVFDQAAIKAVRKWKYRARTKDGIPIATDNVSQRIRFTMEK